MPGQTVATRSGLFTADAAPVALAGVSIDAEISTFCARVAVSQRYVNREAQPIEAVYVFPLDEGAAVCGFEAIVDGTLVVGEVKEREQAFRDYDDAIEKGHGAFLLDEERPDVFQASVGNLPPGKEVLLKITYVTELTVAGSGLRFSIPTTVSPRYAPAVDQRGVGRPDSETLNPPVAWDVPVRPQPVGAAGDGRRHHAPRVAVASGERGDERPHLHGDAVAARRGARPRLRAVGRVRGPRYAAGLDRARRQRRPGGRGGVRAQAWRGDDALRRDVPRRSVRFDGGHVDRPKSATPCSSACAR